MDNIYFGNSLEIEELFNTEIKKKNMIAKLRLIGASNGLIERIITYTPKWEMKHIPLLITQDTESILRYLSTHYSLTTIEHIFDFNKHEAFKFQTIYRNKDDLYKYNDVRVMLDLTDTVDGMTFEKIKQIARYDDSKFSIRLTKMLHNIKSIRIKMYDKELIIKNNILEVYEQGKLFKLVVAGDCFNIWGNGTIYINYKNIKLPSQVQGQGNQIIHSIISYRSF